MARQVSTDPAQLSALRSRKNSGRCRVLFSDFSQTNQELMGLGVLACMGSFGVRSAKLCAFGFEVSIACLSGWATCYDYLNAIQSNPCCDRRCSPDLSRLSSFGSVRPLG